MMVGGSQALQTPPISSWFSRQVQPTMAQFEMDTFAKSHDHMSNFWNACYDAMMSSSQRREQEKAASRKMFQVQSAPHPWDITLGMFSSSWEHARHQGGGLLALGMSS